MPASLIVPALGFTAGTVGYAAATLAVNVVSTLVITSLFNRDVAEPEQQTGQAGGKVQLPPTTDNLLPVVYGDAWTTGIITDVKISNDQQYMWYVLTFCEATDSGSTTFGEVYWDDKLLIFDPANPSELLGWYVEGSNETVFGVAGKISMWFYSGDSDSPVAHYCRNLDGSGGGYFTNTSTAYSSTVLGDSRIQADAWTSQYKMSGATFAVVRVLYDGDRGITGLGQVKVKIQNTLKEPGSVMVDYLTNSRYGCGVDVTDVDTAAFDELDAYAAEQISLPSGDVPGQDDSGTRYEINGIVNTAQDCLTNLVTLADNADSWIQWNEAQGQWSVLINRSLEEQNLDTDGVYPLGPRLITSDNIIGGIQINPLDLNSSYNSIEVQFPNSIFRNPNGTFVLDQYRGQTDFRYSEIPVANRAANEPNNKLVVNLPYTNRSLQATYIAYKRLFTSREDLIINFTMDYSGIQIDAGDVIAIQHEWYNWSAKNYAGLPFLGKPFRVTQVRELKSEDGFLSAQITAVSYNPDVFTTTDPHYFTPSGFSGVSNPSLISKPGTPIYRDDLATSGTNFIVQSTIPTTGNVQGMEFWYSTKGPNLDDNNWILFSTQYYTTVANTTNQTLLYPHTQEDGVTLFFEQISAIGLPSDTYYWRTRAVGPVSTSEFSDSSAAKEWVLTIPNNGIIDGNQIADGTITGAKLVSGDPQQPGNPEQPGFFDTLGPVLLGGMGLAALGWGYDRGWFDGVLGPVQDFFGWGGDSIGTEPYVPSFDIYDQFRQPLQTADVGDYVYYVADTTPYWEYEEPFFYAETEAFTDWDYGYDDWDSGWGWSDYA